MVLLQSHPQSRYYPLEGIYVRVLRSPKFKTKGLVLRTRDRELEIYLPKKLRVLMALEIQPGDTLRVLAEDKKEKIVAINVMKLNAVASGALSLASVTELPCGATSATASDRNRGAAAAKVVKICRRGTCRKRGSLDLLKQWQAETKRDPQLASFDCQLTGCLKKCKAGVNVKVGDRVVSRAQHSSLADIARRA